MAKTGPKPRPWTERYSVNSSTGCFEWTGGRNEKGYGLLVIEGKQRYAHRVVYATVFGELPGGMCVCHKCDNPCCVNPEHLFLGTPADNTADMMRKGRQAFRQLRGERHWKARLRAEDVSEIRRLYAEGGVLQRDLASRFNVPQTQISAVIRRKAWAHIP